MSIKNAFKRYIISVISILKKIQTKCDLVHFFDNRGRFNRTIQQNMTVLTALLPSIVKKVN